MIAVTFQIMEFFLLSMGLDRSVRLIGDSAQCLRGFLSVAHKIRQVHGLISGAPAYPDTKQLEHLRVCPIVLGICR